MISSSIRGPGSDVLLFSPIVEYRVFVYTCAFFNRTASFDKLKNNNNKYKTQFLLKMVDNHNKKQTDHVKSDCKMLYGSHSFVILISISPCLLDCVR